MSSQQRKALVIAFVIGSVLAAAVEIASACPTKGAKGRSSSGLYAQNRSANRQYEETMVAKGRRTAVPPPPAPSAYMATNDYQLASKESTPATTVDAAVFDVATAAASQAAAETSERQQRQTAALEHSWRQEQTAKQVDAAATATAQSGSAAFTKALKN